jgi:hypothetical protein
MTLRFENLASESIFRADLHATGDSEANHVLDFNELDVLELAPCHRGMVIRVDRQAASLYFTSESISKLTRTTID